jgi:malonate-semialdehyde dehydrogenase (acetylating)/methylmalonate-semialdehyde dehydrogenase
MWTLPIALVVGNTIVLKPSEKVPLTMYKTMELLMQAGVPNGVVNLIQGTKRVVEALIDHPQVRAVTFVGSSPVASLVSLRCRNLNKRCCALGGAKNHLVTLPDCDIDSAARDIVASFAGCAGQRCMAASVLLMVGGDYTEKLLAKVTDIASLIQPGNNSSEQGPVIDAASLQRILSYIHGAETSGCKIILDGRKWTLSSKQGYWIGPTIVMHSSPHDVAMVEEIFGPVLSVYQVSSWTDAIKIENDNPYGNAACVYTTSGASGDWFTSRFRASMLGINIGIPVPREPFSFGGLYGTKSKYGDMDITGDGAIEFFSNRIKVSTRWPVSIKTVEVSQSSDYANFAGQM